MAGGAPVYYGCAISKSEVSACLGGTDMTREAILREIHFLPDDMLEAIWNMIVA